MTTFSRVVDIRATPQRVWSVLVDVETWPEWTASVRDVERLNAGPLSVGSRVRIRQPRFPVADWRVTYVEKGRGFTWVTRSPGVSVTASHLIEAVPDGTRATLSIQFEGWLGPLWAWLTRRVTDRYLGLEAAGLKLRSEQRP